MKIKKLHIKNFKSLVDLEIVDPNPFTVFVGANGVGKSNIFEALEFVNFLYAFNNESAIGLFGGNDSLKNRNIQNSLKEINAQLTEITFDFDDDNVHFLFRDDIGFVALPDNYSSAEHFIEYHLLKDGLSFDQAHKMYEGIMKNSSNYFNQFVKSFGRIFIKNEELVRVKEIADKKLGISCKNLELVLKRLLLDENKKEEIFELLQLFIPGFEKLEIQSNNIGGTDTLLVYEKGFSTAFNKSLISDGTFNIICLITAIYQSDEPQFLCIEEPENGLNPFVVKELVNLFRTACEEKGHYIWLNTHSQTLVEMLTPNEIILVDKVDGGTTIKQIKGLNLHGIPTDEAWFSGALGGGTPW